MLLNLAIRKRVLLDNKSSHEFQELYEAQTGIPISLEVAKNKASMIIKLVKILMKEIKEKEVNSEKEK